MSRLRIRPLADRDTDEVAEYLAREANLDVAPRFFVAVESTYDRIAAHAEAGSPVHAFDGRLAGLRYVPGHLNKAHLQEYHEAIFERLSTATESLTGAKYRMALRSELMKIGKDVATPGNPLNKLLTGN